MNTVNAGKVVSLLIMNLFLICFYSNGEYSKISNGDFWYDTDGNKIDAHGGGVVKVDDTYYWFGEVMYKPKKESVVIKCYSSKDLKTWKFENDVITSKTPGFESCAHLQRLKVIYNSSTSQYVLWGHWEINPWGKVEHAVVATCSEVAGDYEFVKHFEPTDLAKDCTLFKDDDGTAYFIFASGNHKDLILCRLTKDYLDIDQVVNADMITEIEREAPAVFKRNGIYYLFTSGCSGWGPNQQKYSTATSIVGPWSEHLNIGNKNGYRTQTHFVLPVEGADETTYLYLGDRYLDPTISSPKNIWLPIEWKGDVPCLNYYDSWWIDVSTGKWIDVKIEKQDPSCELIF